MTVHLHKVIDSAVETQLLVHDNHERFYFVVDAAVRPANEEADIYINDRLSGTVMYFMEHMEARHYLLEEEGRYTSRKLHSSICDSDKQWFQTLCQDDLESLSGNEDVFANLGPTVQLALYGLSPEAPLEQLYMVIVDWEKEKPEDRDIFVTSALQVVTQAMT